eukprot:767159-Hanusia_phi.AAC.3
MTKTSRSVRENLQANMLMGLRRSCRNLFIREMPASGLIVPTLPDRILDHATCNAYFRDSVCTDK